MKRLGVVCLIFCLLAVWSACVGPRGATGLNLTHGANIPDQFLTIVEISAREITFEIKVKFEQNSLYHIVADDQNIFLAEGWFPTSRDGTGIYRVTLTLKKDHTLESGRKYHLCIGTAHPDQVFQRTNNYRCLGYFDFITPDFEK
jgi:hypothetical protein